MEHTGLTHDDDSELTSFIEEHYVQLRRAAASLVERDEHLAQDLVQETCFGLLKHYRACARDGKDPRLTTNLAFTILRRKMISHFRKEAAERRRAESIEVFTATTMARDPGTLVSEDDAKMNFFASCPPEQQMTALLLEAGYNPAEIGIILGKAEGTVRNYKTALRRAFTRSFGY